MDSFEINKIAGAVLSTALGVMALSIVSEIIYSPAHSEPGYVIATADTGGDTRPAGGTGADAAPIGVRLAASDVKAGEAAAKKCLACHTLAKGQPSKVGPNLWGVVGAAAAHMDGFKYSQGMLDQKAKGMTWTYDNLDHFIAAPKAVVAGTAMAFAGIKKADERANVIAYLRTLSDNPVPLPAATAAAPADPAAPAGPAAPEPAKPAAH